MIGALIRRHRANHGFARLIGIAAGTVGLINGLRLFFGASDTALTDEPANGMASGGASGWATGVTIGALWPLTAAVALSLIPFLMYAALSRRYSEHDLTLPVPARNLWLAHVLTLLIESAVMLAIILALSASLDALRYAGQPDGHSPTLAYIEHLTAHTAATLILGIALVGSLHPAAMRFRPARRGVLPVALLTIVYLSLMSGFATLSPWLALLPAAAGVALLRSTYRRFPVMIDYLPTVRGDRVPAYGHPATADEDAERTSDEVKQTRPTGRSWKESSRNPQATLRMTIWRSLNHQYLIWAFYIVLAVLAFLVAGGERLLDEPGGIRFTNVTLIVYMLVLLIPMAMKKLALIDPLPIARSQVLAYLVVPPALILGFTYLGTHVAIQLAHEVREVIAYHADDPENPLRITLEHFELRTLDSPGEVVLITAPWGETHPAHSVTIAQGLPWVLYKPYSAPAGCSRRFLAWQIGRAAEAAYGIRMAPEEIADRYLDAGTQGRLKPESAGLSIVEDYAPPARPLHVRLFPLLFDPRAASVFPCVAAAAGVPWLLLSALACRFYRASRTKRRRNTYAFAVVGGVFLVHMLQFALDATGVWTLRVIPPAVVLAARSIADALPGGTFALYLAGAALILISYRILRREFERVEIPPLDQPLRSVMGDWIPR